MGLFDPGIDRHLISDQGEVVIDEVRKHWAATVWAALELFGGVIVLLLAFFVPPQAWWVAVGRVKNRAGTWGVGGIWLRVTAPADPATA